MGIGTPEPAVLADRKVALGQAGDRRAAGDQVDRAAHHLGHRQRKDEGGDFGGADDQPVEHADRNARRKRGEDRGHHIAARVHHHRGQHAAQARDRADAQVEIAVDDEDRHADAHHAVNGHLAQHADHILDLDEVGVLDRHNDDHQHQHQHQSRIFDQDAQQPAPGPFLFLFHHLTSSIASA